MLSAVYVLHLVIICYLVMYRVCIMLWIYGCAVFVLEVDNYVNTAMSIVKHELSLRDFFNTISALLYWYRLLALSMTGTHACCMHRPVPGYLDVCS